METGNRYAYQPLSGEPMDESVELNRLAHPPKKRPKYIPRRDVGFREAWARFPKTVFPIFGNEFCERFSYYGMRTVLTLYFVNVLGYSRESSVANFHLFIVICYLSPIAGSILADGYIGKFHTILWVSLFYACGNVVLAVAAVYPAGHPVHPALDWIGLVIIGLGTGGIKPCVSAFGGDQFKKGDEDLLEKFFSVFYFSINAGAVISTFLTPELRATSCLGQYTCFPAAFGLPAILMVLSVICFSVGARHYRRVPPSENVIGRVFWVVCHALGNWMSHRGDEGMEREHWVYHWLDDHHCAEDSRCKVDNCGHMQFLTDVRAIFRVLVMYVPIPVFWALYDQQGSRWVLQAVAMDGRVGGGLTLLPDQMGTLNAVLILLFIPVFQWGVYPSVRALGIEPTPLRKIGVGGILISLSFLIAAFVLLKVRFRSWGVYPSVRALGIEPTPLRKIGVGGILISLSFLIAAFVQLKVRFRSWGVYPSVRALGIEPTPLRKIGVGGILISLSFLIAAFVQLKVRFRSWGVYPSVRALGIEPTPLRKIGVGGILISLSFLIAAFVQLKVRFRSWGVYPSVRALGIEPTPLRKIGVGGILISLSFLIAAFVQLKVRFRSWGVYPSVRALGIEPTPLRKIGVGGILISLSFLIAAFVQLKVCFRSWGVYPSVRALGIEPTPLRKIGVGGILISLSFLIAAFVQLKVRFRSWGVYPSVRALGIEPTPLRKIGVGGILISLSFLIAAFVQLKVRFRSWGVYPSVRALGIEPTPLRKIGVGGILISLSFLIAAFVQLKVRFRSWGVYPSVRALGIEPTPLRKIGVGGILISLSFLIAAFVQLKVRFRSWGVYPSVRALGIEPTPLRKIGVGGILISLSFLIAAFVQLKVRFRSWGVYPSVRALGIEPTPLRKIGVGGILISLSFLIAAFVQLKVRFRSWGVYPSVRALGIEPTPLRKIGVGGILISLSFLIAAFVQLKVRFRSWGVYPSVRALGIEPTPLRKIGVGGILISLSFLIAAFVQLKVRFRSWGVYPSVRALGIEPTPLRKIGVGGILISLSFLIAAFVQLKVSATAAHPPVSSAVDVSFVNTLPCALKGFPNGTGDFALPANGTTRLNGIRVGTGKELAFNFTAEDEGCLPKDLEKASLTVKGGNAYFVVLNAEGPERRAFESDLAKSEAGEGQFKLSLADFRNSTYEGFAYWCSVASDGSAPCHPPDPDTFASLWLSPRNASAFVELKPGTWRLFEAGTANRSDFESNITVVGAPTGVELSMEAQGGIYVLAVWDEGAGPNATVRQLLSQMVPDNSVSILWQVPQYVVITASEILFSITGLEFSYSQAPTTMKSVMQAAFLLTVALGDLIDFLIAVGQEHLHLLPTITSEFVFYAILMAVVTVVFALLAQFWYEYTTFDQAEEEEDTKDLVGEDSDDE